MTEELLHEKNVNYLPGRHTAIVVKCRRRVIQLLRVLFVVVSVSTKLVLYEFATRCFLSQHFNVTGCTDHQNVVKKTMYISVSFPSCPYQRCMIIRTSDWCDTVVLCCGLWQQQKKSCSQIPLLHLFRTSLVCNAVFHVSVFQHKSNV